MGRREHASFAQNETNRAATSQPASVAVLHSERIAGETRIGTGYLVSLLSGLFLTSFFWGRGGLVQFTSAYLGIW